MIKTICYKLTSPLSHIGETSSTGSYFQTILTSYGRIPVITGNSVRGQIRDSAALHLLERLGIKVDKDVFNILFSGGNINGTLREDVGKAKNVRRDLPLVSLLGGGLGDMIMSGKMMVSFAYPICIETEKITGIPSDISWHDLIDEIEFTRMDDGKKDELAGKYITDPEQSKTAKASTQMRYSVQYMAPGTEFIQNFMFMENTTELELGVFYAGIDEWFKNPKLGGMGSKGFGFFDAKLSEGEIMLVKGECTKNKKVTEFITRYEEFIDSQGEEMFKILAQKGGSKNGKKTD
nr:MAG TPA: CRISPR type IV/AFERR-associated protein [Caudoviricetes sp.]